MVANGPIWDGANLLGLPPYQTACQILRTGVVAAALMAFGTLAQSVSGDAGADDQKKAKATSGTVKEPSLRQELLKRMDEDQKVRQGLVELMAKKAAAGPTAAKELASVVDRVEQVDARNRARMKEIVDHYGWPGKSLVGKDGANAAWLFVQHADPDPAFQKRCFGLLAEAVKKKEATPQHLAYLTDRVRVGEKAKQVYGTQFCQ